MTIYSLDILLSQFRTSLFYVQFELLLLGLNTDLSGRQDRCSGIPITLRIFKFTVIYFSGGSDGKVSVYNAGDLGSIPGSGKFPGEGNGNPPPVLLLGKFDGQKSLVPLGRKESDRTERLHFHFHTVKGFGVVNKTEVDVFSGTLLLFQWSNRCWQFYLWFLWLFFFFFFSK